MSDRSFQQQQEWNDNDQEMHPLALASPVPQTVSIENDILSKEKPLFSSSKLKYGTATPGTMATVSSFISPGNGYNDAIENKSSSLSSPLGLFASFALSSSRTLFGDENMNKSSTNTDMNRSKKELKINAEDPIKSEKSDDNSVTTMGSTPTQENQCLGIEAPAYSAEDDESVASTDSNRIGIERTNYQIPEGDIPLSPLDPFFQRKKQTRITPNDHDDDGHDLWQLKLQQQANRMNHDTIQEEEENDEEANLPPDDSIQRFIHEPTAQGHYLVNSHPLDAPQQGLQYSLNKGKSAMPPLLRRLSKSTKFQSKTRPNITVEHQKQSQQQQEQPQSTPKTPITSSPSAAASFKIFVLLVAPKNKIFEIIQVFYAPLETTVNDLIQCIPPNATEPALASQKYTGMCRLDGQTLNVDMMASAASSSARVECAKIVRGEVLVAIPKGYTAKFCSLIAKPILSNPKVTKLLQRSDPLAPSKKKKKPKKSSSNKKMSPSSPTANYKTIEVKSETAMITSPYQYYNKSSPTKYNTPDAQEQRLLKALQRGTSEAESTNAELCSSKSAANHNSLAMDNFSVGTDLSFDNIDDNQKRQHEENHHHLPMELWQTQMSLRSDSSSTASSVDSSFMSSPLSTSLPSPSSFRNRYQQQQQRRSGSGGKAFSSPITPGSVVTSIPEVHLESPTLGLDIEVYNPTREDAEDAATNALSKPSTPSDPDGDDIMAKLSLTLANKDVQGAMEAFGKLLRQNQMISSNSMTSTPVGENQLGNDDEKDSNRVTIPPPSLDTAQEEQNAILAKLIQAVQQHSMER